MNRTALLIPFMILGCMQYTQVKKKKSPSKQSVYHYKLARNYVDVHNIPMAFQELRHSLNLNPNNAKAHHLRGFILMGRDDMDGAIREFQQTLKIDPGFYPARNNLGSAYIAMGRYRDAIRELKPLLTEEMYPTPYLAEGNIGWAWFKIGDLEKAKQHLQRAVFLNHRFCLGFDELGIVLFKQNRLNDAMMSLKQVIKKCPKFPEPYLYKGLILEKQGNYQAARKAYKKCAKRGGDSQIGQRCNARLGK